MSDIFDHRPQIIDLEHGAEPSLRQLVYKYYYDTGFFTPHECDNLMNKYMEYMEEFVKKLEPNAKQSDT